MTEIYFPFDSGAGANVSEYQWSLMARNWIPTGVLKNILNELQPYADSTGMQIKIKSGAAWMQGHYYQTDAEIDLPISTADSTSSRIDKAVIRIDWGANTIGLYILQGALGGLEPVLTQNTSIWEAPLCKINVNAGVTTINPADITDERVFTGFPMSAGVSPFTVAVRDSAGNLPGNITGTAADSSMLGGQPPSNYLTTTGIAADSSKLGGQLASSYLTTSGVAADSAKLGGQPPSNYLTTTGIAADSSKLGGQPASSYLTTSGVAADSAKLGGQPASSYLTTTTLMPQKFVYINVNFTATANSSQNYTIATGLDSRFDSLTCGISLNNGSVIANAVGHYGYIYNCNNYYISTNYPLKVTAVAISGGTLTIGIQNTSTSGYGVSLNIVGLLF